jgi:transcriptional antiterminator RfaH
MPVLRAEPAMFPADLFEAMLHQYGEAESWHVLHTLPQQEKSLARALRRAGIAYYLPTLPRQHRWQGRVVTSHIPLLPGYVPILGGREDLQSALATRRVVRALKVSDQGKFVNDLNRIRQLLASGAPMAPEGRCGPGHRVRIRSGPLAGLDGTVLRRSSGQRLLVMVDFLQRGASVLLEGLDLEQLD